MAEQKKAAPVVPDAREATYVVQRETKWTDAGRVPSGVSGWEDVATVSVPAKSKRKTIIGLALVRAEIRPQPGDEPLRLRVLPAAAAVVTTVAAVAVEPQLELS